LPRETRPTPAASSSAPRRTHARPPSEAGGHILGGYQSGRCGRAAGSTRPLERKRQWQTQAIAFGLPCTCTGPVLRGRLLNDPVVILLACIAENPINVTVCPALRRRIQTVKRKPVETDSSPEKVGLLPGVARRRCRYPRVVIYLARAKWQARRARSGSLPPRGHPMPPGDGLAEGDSMAG
jgi:hypothetical protein